VTNYRAKEGGYKVTSVEFINENGGSPGVRLRKRQRAKQSK
jgi:hypothetical protein